VQQEIVSVALIGNETNNVFIIRNDNTTAKAEFHATIDDTSLNEALKAGVKNVFSICLNKAEAVFNPPSWQNKLKYLLYRRIP